MFAKFVIRISIFLLVLSGFNYLLFWMGTRMPVDEFYLRFTGEKKKNLIMGSSRSAQALDPDLVFGEGGMNFSFTLANSPYGEVYRSAIARKLSGESGGVFILEVNPLSLSVRKSVSSDSVFPEEHLFLGEQLLMNGSVNIEYILRNYPKPLYRLFTDRKESSMLLHGNGWLEINIPMDSHSVEKRKRAKFREYMEIFSDSRMSPDRLASLRSIISDLKPFGKVILVRLPVDLEMLRMENSYAPDFNQMMLDLCESGVAFLDLTYLSGKVRTTDGNHLFKDDSRYKVSPIIRNFIQDQFGI